MTEFKKGDRVLVPGVIEDTYDGGRTVKVATVNQLVYFYQDAGMVQLAPDQSLKEGDQVVTLGGSTGLIRAIYKDEAYVILLDSATRSSITCDLKHLRRAPSVDVIV